MPITVKQEAQLPLPQLDQADGDDLVLANLVLSLKELLPDGGEGCGDPLICIRPQNTDVGS